MHPSARTIVELYERHALSYDKERGRTGMEHSWLDRFAALIPERAPVLDIGCGSGEPIAADLIARGLTVTGVDSSPAMIAQCRRRFPENAWYVADMRRLALDARFDGIIAWDSFFHLSPGDQRCMFEIFARHAAPRAALMFTSGPDAGEAIGSWHGEPLYHASLAPAEYTALLSSAGFDVVTHVASDPYCGGHTVWLAQRS